MAQVSRFSLGTRSASSADQRSTLTELPSSMRCTSPMPRGRWPPPTRGRARWRRVRPWAAMTQLRRRRLSSLYEGPHRPTAFHAAIWWREGCRQGGRERARVSEQTRASRCARWGRPGLPPGTPCSSRPRPCTWSTAAVRTLPTGKGIRSLFLEKNNTILKQHDHPQRR